MQGIEKKAGANNLLLLLVILMMARFSCIILSDVPLMSMGFMFIYGFFFSALFLIGERYFKKREFSAFIFLIMYTVDVAFITITSTGEIFNTQAYNAYVMFFLYLIYLFIKRVNCKKSKTIFGIVVAGFLLTYITSIIKLIQDPLLSRKAASTAVDEESVAALGSVGGFDTVYGSILVVCILLFMMERANRVLMKLLFVLIISICCLFLLMASYGTALVLLVLLFALWLFQKNRWIGLSVLVVGILIFAFHDNIGMLISKFSEQITYSRTLSQKIDQIGEILQTGKSAGTLAGEEGRLARMGWSWNAFTTYPIFGGFEKADVQIGHHSELFDTLGRFGIVGAVSLFTFLGLVFRDIYMDMTTMAGKKCCLICLILYVAIVVLNPALYTQQLLPIFVLLPLYESVSKERGMQNV